MSPFKFVQILFLCLAVMPAIQSCNKSASPSSPQSYNAAIKQQIANGKRLENINNDSLGITAQKLYLLNKQSGDKEALVYAELFEATWLWQSADHKRAMELAIKSRSDADRYAVKAPLPQIFGLIGNLHKETTNYNMAFIAADSGLNAAKSNKDTVAIISLLGLKAMFTRGYALEKHLPAGKNDKSLQLNLQALKIAESNPKYERLRMRFYSNISQFYKDEGIYDSTFYYGYKGVALDIKQNSHRSLTYVYCWLGEANYFKGNRVTGINYLNKALQEANLLHEPFRVMEIYECFYDCYTSSADYKKAIHYYVRSRIMRDSLKLLDNVKQISELQIKYETAKKDQNIAGLKAKSDAQNLQLLAISIVLILLLIIGILFYLQEKKGKELAISEKQLLDTELKNATLELQYFTENLKQKNEIIEEFKSRIENMHQQNISKADIEGLELLVKEHIMTDESWDKFKALFRKVHNEFFNILQKRYPDLTPTDTRILSLVKLKLSNYEMANMLGITLEGIKKSKQRLRKKMNIEREDSLEFVIESL